MKINMKQAIDFVYKNGNIFEKARLDAILRKKKPAKSVVGKILDLQNEDGGFPYNKEKGKPSTISDTSVALIWLNDLKMLNSDTGKKAIKHLISLQKENGSWDENPEISNYNPPVWMTPGDKKTIVYNTAYSAFWLGISGHRESLSFKKAYNFLIECQNESGRFEGFLHSTWIGASVIAIVEGWESNRVRMAIKYLDNVDSDKWVASQISWMLWCFALADVPKENIFVSKMLNKLRGKQRDDGSFASEDGEEFAVGATLEAIKVILLYEKEDLVDQV